MRGARGIEDGPLQVVATRADHAGHVEIIPGIGCNESRLGEEISVKYIEWLALVFFHKEFEPIDEGIVHAFMRAETRYADPVRGESPRFGGEQVQRRREDTDVMFGRGQ